MMVELMTALALVLVIEGLLPFLNPAAYKSAMASILRYENRVLRIVGLCSMITGVVILTVVR